MKTILVGLLTAAVVSMASPARAQSAPDAWQVTVTPYLLGAGVTGTFSAGPLEAEVDASLSDVLSNLEFGFMGLVGARKGNWGVGADVIYVGLGATAQQPAADIDVDQTLLAFYGLRRLGAGAELTFGARVNGIKTGIALKDGSGRATERDKWWLDPLVGLNLRTPATGKLSGHAYVEVGGFGVGSQFAWQVFPAAVIAISERGSLELGYRWLGIDYEWGGEDQFGMDTVTHGPVVGFAFRF